MKKSIAIRLRKTKEEIIITVTDEGIGIDENIDLFAPFKKSRKSKWSWTWVFLLCKNAADALRAKVTLKNREDGKVDVLKACTKQHIKRDLIKIDFYVLFSTFIL